MKETTRQVDNNWDKVGVTIDWFSSLMRGKMAANTHKGDWNNVKVSDLEQRFAEELEEFKAAKRKSDKVLELADIANICMILADNIRGSDDKAPSS